MSAQLTNALKTLAKVFFGAAFGVLVTFGDNILDMSMTDLKLVFAAGIAAVVVFVYNYLSPNDHRYGIGSDTEE